MFYLVRVLSPGYDCSLWAFFSFFFKGIGRLKRSVLWGIIRLRETVDLLFSGGDIASAL